MEVIEIITNFINVDNNVVDVEFRVMGDNEDVVRQDTIEFEQLSDFGYGNFFNSLDIFDDMDDEWDDEFDIDDNDFFIDEEDLKEFLNEYYIVYPNRLPDSELN